MQRSGLGSVVWCLLILAPKEIKPVLLPPPNSHTPTFTPPPPFPRPCSPPCPSGTQLRGGAELGGVHADHTPITSSRLTNRHTLALEENNTPEGGFPTSLGCVNCAFDFTLFFLLFPISLMNNHPL